MTMVRWRALVPAILLTHGCAATRVGPSDGTAGAGDTSAADAPALLDGGSAGYALDFDGVDDYATAGNGGFPMAGGDLTIEMWVRYASAATDQDFIVMRLDAVSGLRLGIYAGAIDVRRVYVDRVLDQAPVLPVAGQWHHLAFVSYLTVNLLYVDGVQVDAGTDATDGRTPTSVWLGTFDGSTNMFKGGMDEVRVWSIARSATEVQADMHRRPLGSEPGLVAYWTFDDPQNGARSSDASGAGNDVTLGDGITQRMPTRVPSDAPAGN